MKNTKEYEKALEIVSDFIDEYEDTYNCYGYLEIYDVFDNYIEKEVIALNEELAELEKKGELIDLDWLKGQELIESYPSLNDFVELVKNDGINEYEYSMYINEIIFFDNDDARELYNGYIQGNSDIEYKIIYDYTRYDSNVYIDKELQTVYEIRE